MGVAGDAVLETLGRHESDEVVMRLTTGVLGLAEFALQPMTLAVLYLAGEGVIRAIAAAFTHQNLGTLPLYLLSRAGSVIDKGIYRLALGRSVIDVVEPATDSTYHIRVLSSRPKLDWNPYITIRFEGEFYTLVGEETGDRPHRFVYKLRKNPIGKLVLIIRDYHLVEKA